MVYHLLALVQKSLLLLHGYVFIQGQLLQWEKCVVTATMYNLKCSTSPYWPGRLFTSLWPGSQNTPMCARYRPADCLLASFHSFKSPDLKGIIPRGSWNRCFPAEPVCLVEGHTEGNTLTETLDT